MREDMEAIAHSDGGAATWEATCTLGSYSQLQLQPKEGMTKKPTALVFSLAFPQI